MNHIFNKFLVTTKTFIIYPKNPIQEIRFRIFQDFEEDSSIIMQTLGLLLLRVCNSFKYNYANSPSSCVQFIAVT